MPGMCSQSVAADSQLPRNQIVALNAHEIRLQWCHLFGMQFLDNLAWFILF
jgi:hypothetical protein